jgi:hypothetical protein
LNTKIILYSCSTWLSFQINRLYYNNLHYTWCTPYFDPQSQLNPQNSVPPTSSPKEIYWNLKKEIDAGDRHSAKVAQNKIGLQRGADVKLRNNIITSAQHKEILEIIEASDLQDYRPILYIIPAEPIRPLLQLVPIKDRANILSEEYIIEQLPRHLFDAIELS